MRVKASEARRENVFLPERKTTPRGGVARGNTSFPGTGNGPRVKKSPEDTYENVGIFIFPERRWRAGARSASASKDSPSARPRCARGRNPASVPWQVRWQVRWERSSSAGPLTLFLARPIRYKSNSIGPVCGPVSRPLSKKIQKRTPTEFPGRIQRNSQAARRRRDRRRRARAAASRKCR